MESFVLPRGLLVAEDFVAIGLNDETDSRPIDGSHAAPERHTQYSRRNTINLGGLARTRETGHEFRNVNNFPIAQREQTPQARRDSSIDPLEPTTVLSQERPRRISIEVSALARPDFEGHLIPSSHTTASSSGSSSASQFWSSQGGSISSTTHSTRDGSGIFLSSDLRRYAFPHNEDGNFQDLSLDSRRYGAPENERSKANDGVAVLDFADTWHEAQQNDLRQMQGHRSATRSRRLTRLASWAVGHHGHRSSLHDLYEKAKYKQKAIRRSPLVQWVFEYTMYILMVIFTYIVLVGIPLWKGAVYCLYFAVAHKLVIPGGFAITVGIAALYAFAPLFILLDKDPPPLPPNTEYKPQLPCHIALIIPCYKSGKLISATLKAALKLFPPENIFVIANGNSPTPLDNTGDICALFGVSHTWCPLGSKIIAQFVGCKVAEKLPYVLMIDDDCLLPPDFPMGIDWCTGKIKCIGYTITSVGPGGTKGTLVQQAQDMEYKLSGLQRQFAGKIGSATFPHGAISMWESRCLVQTFYEHPGFSVSEDWFFGHVARQLGSRILMNSEVFVETETPCAIFFAPKDEARGGFGEMTVFKQRFERWNFFFVNGIYWDILYIVCNWKLGWWEVGAKFFVFQEVYETLLYLLTPFLLPIAVVVRPIFCVILLVATFALYLLNTIIFNLIHLRRKKKVLPNGEITTHAISTKAIAYYMPYKMVLTAVNVASCYWSIYKYARYFAKRHPKVVEDEKVIEVVLNLDMRGGGGRTGSVSVHSDNMERRLTIVAVVTRGSKALSGSVCNNNM